MSRMRGTVGTAANLASGVTRPDLPPPQRSSHRDVLGEDNATLKPPFFSLASPFVLGLLFLVGLLTALIEFGILGYAYEKLGVNHRYVLALLLLCLLGSYVNIPVAEWPAESVLSGQAVTYYGMRYVIPVVEQWPGTILAVNVGGAIIPTLLSLSLLVKHGGYGRSLLGVAIVTAVVHWLAQPIKGVGIAVPVFIPPVV